jgi:hypothetical protein
MSVMSMTQERVGFDVDAMLMYGWVADKNRRVTHVSNSLRRWIRDHREEAPDALELLDRVGEKSDVTVEKFLQSLLDPKTEKGTAAFVTEYMTKLEDKIVERDPYDRRPPAERVGPYEVLVHYHAPSKDGQPLVGARFVRDSATLLASCWNAERVDIVVVAIVEAHDGWWRVRGFQGQLQEAWLRVRNRIVDGNRAAGIALMARNMSHNIGSHALYWVASKSAEKEKRFLTYLQARMELLAGFATKVPLSPVTSKLKDVVKGFNETKLLLDNISRSESVSSVNVELTGYRDEAIFFGGEIGMHAFYSILENCIRDSSKHAPRKREGAQTLTMRVVATPIDGFVQIDVYDDSNNYAQHGADLREAVERLRLADESGKLDPVHWGIKERFVCAAILRGLRPEDFRLQESAAPDTPLLATYLNQGRRVLEVMEVDGNCAWRFYLPRRYADVLMITGQQTPIVGDGVIVQSPEAFVVGVNSVSGITTPFVVIDDLPPTVDMRALEGRLPHHSYVRGFDAGIKHCLRIDSPLESITSTLLLRRSVQELMTEPSRLIVGVNEHESGRGLTLSMDDADGPFIVNINDVESTVERLYKRNPREKLLVMLRHPTTFFERLVAGAARGSEHHSIGHFEIYSVRHYLEAAVLDLGKHRERASLRLLEAALTKILIIDERLDVDLGGKPGAVRGCLALRGVTVRGSEFAGHATLSDRKTADDVRQWAKGFHFLMLHWGVAEKLKGKDEVADVIKILEQGGTRVVIHSGRAAAITGEMPLTKFLSLANVARWINQDYSKLEIVDELFPMRGV